VSSGWGGEVSCLLGDCCRRYKKTATWASSRERGDEYLVHLVEAG